MAKSCSLEEKEKYRRGLEIYRNLLGIALEHGSPAAMLADENFLKTFGARTYFDLDPDIIGQVESIFKMSNTQIASMHETVAKALEKGGTQEAFRNQLIADKKAFAGRHGKSQATIDKEKEPIESKLPTDHDEFLTNLIAAGLTEQQIVDKVNDLAGGSLTDQHKASIVKQVREARLAYTEFTREVNNILESIYDGGRVSQFLTNMAKSPWRNTQAFQDMQDRLAQSVPYDLGEARDWAEKFVKQFGIKSSIKRLEKEAGNKNSPLTPILGAAIMQASTKNSSNAAEALETVAEFAMGAGRNLRAMRTFYEMIGMATYQGKSLFFKRIVKKMEDRMINRINNSTKDKAAMKVVMDFTKKVFADTHDPKVRARLQSIIDKINC